MFSPLIDQLITSLRCLPGVGPKSAQRMAFHILERGRDQAGLLAKALQEAIEKVGHCQRCRTLCETPLCQICADPKREPDLLCVVEMPADVLAIEQSGEYRGTYFVLMGRLSPIDGMGPEALGLEQLQQRLQADPIREVIIATNTTVEGETTAFYIAKITQNLGVTTTRIAHGVPLGGELEQLDGGTLSRALTQRAAIPTE